MSPPYSPRLRAALLLAERAHRGQLRKGSVDVPYVLHPIAVAAALASAGAPEDIVCAGYLHDAVEDTDVELAHIADRFGARVAELVAAVSERKHDAGGQPIPWPVRKEASLAHLRATEDADVHALKAADLLINLTDIVLDHGELGDAVWARFNRGRDAQLGYYAAAAELVVPRVELPALAAALVEMRGRLLALGTTVH